MVRANRHNNAICAMRIRSRGTSSWKARRTPWRETRKQELTLEQDGNVRSLTGPEIDIPSAEP